MRPYPDPQYLQSELVLFPPLDPSPILERDFHPLKQLILNCLIIELNLYHFLLVQDLPLPILYPAAF